MAAKFTPEAEGLAGEGWNIKPDVLIDCDGHIEKEALVDWKRIHVHVKEEEWEVVHRMMDKRRRSFSADIPWRSKFT